MIVIEACVPRAADEKTAGWQRSRLARAPRRPVEICRVLGAGR